MNVLRTNGVLNFRKLGRVLSRIVGRDRIKPVSGFVTLANNLIFVHSLKRLPPPFLDLRMSCKNPAICHFVLLSLLRSHRFIRVEGMD